jgi:lysophospholipase L1-like esterase
VGKRAFLIALSFLVSAAFCEGLLRLLWTNPYRSELPEQVISLRMQHALRTLPVDRSQVYPDSPTALLRTDERAYILPSHQFEQPDVTIAFIGGSTTECAAVTEELRFPALVSTLLKERGLRVNTLNAGYSGNTTHDAVNLLFNHVVEDRPNVVVLMEAANDIGVYGAEQSYASRGGAPLRAGTALRWAMQAASSRLSLIGALRSYLTLGPVEMTAENGAFRERKKMKVSPEAYVQRLHVFVRMARAFGIEPVLMTQPAIGMRTALTPDWIDTGSQSTFNDEIRKVAAEENVVLIDLARHLAENVPDWQEPLKVFYDGVHVNDEGSRIYAKHIADRLLDTVLRRSGTLGDHDEEAPLAAPAQDGTRLDH